MSDSGRFRNALRSSETLMLSGYVVVHNLPLGVDSNCVHVELLEGLDSYAEMSRTRHCIFLTILITPNHQHRHQTETDRQTD